MAQETLDFVIENFEFDKPLKPCQTDNFRVYGSENYEKTKKTINTLSKNEKLNSHLLELYGDQSLDILKLIQKYPEYISEKYFITKAELIYSIQNEFIKKPLDFIVRRTQIGLIDRNHSKEILQEVTQIIGENMGWDEHKIYEEYQEALEILNTDI
jgi:glycerol-3-phosphate dehydrogenase